MMNQGLTSMLVRWAGRALSVLALVVALISAPAVASASHGSFDVVNLSGQSVVLQGYTGPNADVTAICPGGTPCGAGDNVINAGEQLHFELASDKNPTYTFKATASAKVAASYSVQLSTKENITGLPTPSCLSSACSASGLTTVLLPPGTFVLDTREYTGYYVINNTPGPIQLWKYTNQDQNLVPYQSMKVRDQIGPGQAARFVVTSSFVTADFQSPPNADKDTPKDLFAVTMGNHTACAPPARCRIVTKNVFNLT